MSNAEVKYHNADFLNRKEDRTEKIEQKAWQMHHLMLSEGYPGLYLIKHLLHLVLEGLKLS